MSAQVLDLNDYRAAQGRPVVARVCPRCHVTPAPRELCERCDEETMQIAAEHAGRKLRAKAIKHCVRNLIATVTCRGGVCASCLDAVLPRSPVFSDPATGEIWHGTCAPSQGIA